MKTRKMKNGAASFYVIAFSTLILLIIVASFTALVIAQITRSSNDDLSQSAYDSALAGVEDAKLAYYNYQACLAQGATAERPSSINPNGGESLSCRVIVWLMEQSGVDGGEKELSDVGINSCDVVPIILGRKIDETGVKIKEAENVNNNMQQSYTCVKINTTLPNFRATVSEGNQIRVVQPKFSVASDNIVKMRISWGVGIDKATFVSSGTFPKNTTANPPAIAVALVQAGGAGEDEGFTMNDFNLYNGFGSNSTTNRGMVYLIPRKSTGFLEIGSDRLLKSNNKLADDAPVDVDCSHAAGSGYECSLDMTLPKPIGGKRSDDNFVVAVMSPYGNTADFQLEFFCDEGDTCSVKKVWSEELGESETGSKEQATLDGMQISIDSTGRANDLFRRVEARLEGADSFAMSLMGPLELVGDKNGSNAGSTLLKKDSAITCEYQFSPTAGNCGF